MRRRPLSPQMYSAFWQMNRFRRARRHKAALGSGIVVALAVLGALVVSAVSHVRIAREQGLKDEALATAVRNYEASEANLLLARKAVDEIYEPVAQQLAVLPYMQPYQRDVLEKSLRFYQEFAR